MNPRNEEGEGDDVHNQDIVMPGFRFHPTEEELIEFYLRRKVGGKRFNVDLITFLDLYRYDPWELPALAAIGEKEWFFYVPRDRKYRNGDRPNRVTTSGYWKATGADRTIQSESSRSIGLKKTLVFYSGKAPRGTRTSWIMNEYRLPQNETSQSQKAEISLCRVYKRPGVAGDRHQFTGNLQSKHPSPSKQLPHLEKKGGAASQRTTMATKILSSMASEQSPSTTEFANRAPPHLMGVGLPSPIDDVGPSKGKANMDSCIPFFSFAANSSMAAATADEVNKLMGFHQLPCSQLLQGSAPPPSQQQPLLPLPTLPNPIEPFSTDKFWEWNPVP